MKKLKLMPKLITKYHFPQLGFLNDLFFQFRRNTLVTGCLNLGGYVEQNFLLKAFSSSSHSQSCISYFQVMEKLVDIVHYLHLEIHEAFGVAGMLQKFG